MHRILILSNDETTQSKAEEDLMPLGYTVEMDSVEAIQQPKPWAVDAILLDLSDSQSDRRALFRVLRRLPELRDIPIIALLTGAQLKGFDFSQGADDFVLVPWNTDELDTRIKQALWRASKIDADHILKVGDIVIDLANFEVSIRGKPIDLTYKEYELLKFLATHKERVHTRDILLNQVWGYDYFGGTRTVDVHVRRVRSKIGDPDGTLIQTVRNVGYRLTEKAR